MLKNCDSTNKPRREQEKSEEHTIKDAVKRRDRLLCYKFLFYGRSQDLSALDQKEELNLSYPRSKVSGGS